MRYTNHKQKFLFPEILDTFHDGIDPEKAASYYLEWILYRLREKFDDVLLVQFDIEITPCGFDNYSDAECTFTVSANGTSIDGSLDIGAVPDSSDITGPFFGIYPKRYYLEEVADEISKKLEQ